MIALVAGPVAAAQAPAAPATAPADPFKFSSEAAMLTWNVKADQTEASKWFRLAGEQGDSRALYYLGKMYENGEGVERDAVAAHTWLSLSAKYAPNSRDAAYTREDIKKLERKMKPEQIAQAKEMAGKWKPVKNDAVTK